MSNPQSKRDELLHQAEILFADKGFYGTSINNVACELGMTVSRLRTELTDAELIYFAAYHEIKAEREQQAMDRAKLQRR